VQHTAVASQELQHHFASGRRRQVLEARRVPRGQEGALCSDVGRLTPLLRASLEQSRSHLHEIDPWPVIRLQEHVQTDAGFVHAADDEPREHDE
jgi:hypothetical protein